MAGLAAAAERRIAALIPAGREGTHRAQAHRQTRAKDATRGPRAAVQAAQALDAQAHKHGTTKSELIAGIMESARTGTQLLQTDQVPILPN